MFKHTREPGGRLNYLMAGIACLVLAAIAAALGVSWCRTLNLPEGVGALAGLPFAVGGLSLIGSWWSRRRTERYDLGRLWEEAPGIDEPLEDTMSDEGAPYCGWCDEAYPPGTYRCAQCGRELG